MATTHQHVQQKKKRDNLYTDVAKNNKKDDQLLRMNTKWDAFTIEYSNVYNMLDKINYKSKNG